MDQSSQYGPPVRRKTDGSLYDMTLAQQRQAARMIQRYCCNCERGNCLLLEDWDERVCPQRVSFSVGCRWFQNAVLPLSSELEASIFKDSSLKRCARCGTGFVPRSNRGRYCTDCAAKVRKEKDRIRKQNQRNTVRI